tara:strand:- start:128 stop:577 length:450 start_codon:yes stop_codon:yes gene_type:complete
MLSILYFRNFKMDIEFKARKILEPMASFVKRDDLKQEWADYVCPLLKGKLIGIYFNSNNSLDDAIVVSDTELLLVRFGECKSILFQDIKSIKMPEKDDDSCTIILSLPDRKQELVAINNGRGNCKDVYEFLRFLMRVIEKSLYEKITVN